MTQPSRSTAVDELLPQHVPLDLVAERLGIARGDLLDMARRGRFPTLLRVSERRAFVRVDELERWLLEHRDGAEHDVERRGLARELQRSPFRDPRPIASRRSGGASA
jgi:hypothetical protein